MDENCNYYHDFKSFFNTIKEIDLKPIYSLSQENNFREDMVQNIYTLASKDLLEELVIDRLNNNFKILRSNKGEEGKQEASIFNSSKIIRFF